VATPWFEWRSDLGQQTVAASAVPLELGALSRLFGIPREMTEESTAATVRPWMQKL
jgi:hypothetical protein